MRDIFFDIIGQFDESAKTLLVLIDNIGSKRCRRDLINRLHNGNTAGIKTFEQITGIKLAKTQKERSIQLETITKSDYTSRPKQYIPRTPKNEAEYNDIYYKYAKCGKGINPEFVESKGQIWKTNGYDFFIAFNDNNYPATYAITEGKTGYKVASGSTLEETQDIVRDLLNNIHIGKPMDIPFAEMIEKAINKTGISPLYQRKV